MKILAVGDLHYDQWDIAAHDPLLPIREDLNEIDALFILGDLTNDPLSGWPKALEALKSAIDPAKIWILPGNHDYYEFHLNGDDSLREIAEDYGMNFMQKRAFVMGGVRFLACTLWTDFKLRGQFQQVLDLLAAEQMKDYRFIKAFEGGPLARPSDTIAVFQDHYDWLMQELGQPFEGRTVVLTHHVPSRSVSGRLDANSPGYGSDLDGFIHHMGPDVWLSGHTHRRLEADVARTRIRNVSLGYPWEVTIENHREILLAGLMDTELPGLLVRE